MKTSTSRRSEHELELTRSTTRNEQMCKGASICRQPWSINTEGTSADMESGNRTCRLAQRTIHPFGATHDRRSIAQEDRQPPAGSKAARPRLAGNDGQHVRRHHLREYAERIEWAVPIEKPHCKSAACNISPKRGPPKDQCGLMRVQLSTLP